jgi:CRP/FNR family transcriptional regulator, cyclic AMP receptor protein
MFFHRHGELGKRYADGEVIVGQGEKTDCLYVVQSGQVQALRTEQGTSTEFTTLGPGEMYGLSGFFMGEPMPHAVVAKGETSILTIDKKLFLQRVGEDPTLAFVIIRGLLERLHSAGDRLARLRLDDHGDPAGGKG